MDEDRIIETDTAASTDFNPVTSDNDPVTQLDDTFNSLVENVEESSEVSTTEDNTTQAVKDEIPVNSPSLLIKESTSRFSGALWYDKIQETSVVLAGLGGIGSYVAFLLSRMRPSRIVLYDDDIVEEVNMSGQLYSIEDIGSYKSYAIDSKLRSYSNYYGSVVRNIKYTEDSPGSSVMICGFDNMEARKTFYYNWKKFIQNNSPARDLSKFLFIDGRLAAEELQVIAITGDNTEAMLKYENEWLFDDTEAEATVCSFKQTTFMANMIASFMVNIFVNFVANQCDPLFPRDVPFLTTFKAATMHYKIEI